MAVRTLSRCRHFAVVIGAGCMFAVPAVADDPLACLDPAVADTLLAKPNEGRYTVTRSWPDQFAPVEVPREFTLVGSRTGQYRSIVAFKTELSPAESIAQFESVATGSGWERSQASSLSVQGFQLPRNVSDSTSINVCKPAVGQVSAEAFPATDGGTYVTLTDSGQSARRGL